MYNIYNIYIYNLYNIYIYIYFSRTNNTIYPRSFDIFDIYMF